MSDQRRELDALRRTVDVLKRRVARFQDEQGDSLLATMPELKAIVAARTESLLRSKQQVERLVRERTTELQRKNEELERANLLLQEMDRMKDNLLQNVSHELKTPLVSIRGYSELLRSRYGENLDDTQREFLEIIIRNADNLNRVIEGLVQASQSVRGVSPVERRVLSVAPILEEVLQEIQPVAMQADVDVRSEVQEGDDLRITGDPHQIRQLLVNLIGNAIKFTAGCERREVRVRLDRRGKQVVLVVSDTGIGIAEEQLPRIFDRFYQVDPSVTRRYGGMGIGLSLVKEIVENHDASLNVQSRPGEGSTFTIAIAAVSAAERPVAQSSPPGTGSSNAGAVAYVLEPQPEAAALFQTVLTEAGFVVELVDTLDDLWSQDVPQGSLLLLDGLGLSASDEDALRRLQSLADATASGNAPLRIILTTTNEPTGAWRRKLLAVVDRILCKPFALDDLVQALKDLFPGGLSRGYPAS